MIDHDPDLKWSNAWWARVIFGVTMPALLALAAGAALLAGKAYFLGGAGVGRRLAFVLVEGEAARWMALGYLGLGVASFAYAYARHDLRLAAYADALLAAGLLATFGALARCAWVVMAL